MPRKLVKGKGGGKGYFEWRNYESPEGSIKKTQIFVWVKPPRGYEVRDGVLFPKGELLKPEEGMGENTFAGHVEKAKDKHRDELQGYGDNFGRRR